MGTILASDWSSDVRSHVMVGNRGPGGKKGSWAHRKSRPLTRWKKGIVGSPEVTTADQVEKRDRGLREVTWFGKPLTS